MLKNAKKTYAFILLCAALAIVGCTYAKIPMASLDADRSAKTFKGAPDLANIYVYRPEGEDATDLTFSVAVDGKIVGTSAARTYILHTIPPGRHSITIVNTNYNQRTVFTTEAGQNYFFKVYGYYGEYGPVGEISAAPDSNDAMHTIRTECFLSEVDETP
jgi:hypothetical protein